MNQSPEKVFTIPLKFEQSPALISSVEKWRWCEFHIRIKKRQRALQQKGFRAGDTCAIFAPPSTDYLETLFAMWSMGVIAVPLNIRLPHEQIIDMLTNINCTRIICGTNSQIFQLDFLTFSDLISAPLEQDADIFFQMDTPTTIIFTSGSTGRAKACLHTFGNHYFNALGSNENIKLQPGDSWLLSLPLYHVAGIGILFRCLVAGAAIALSSPEKTLAENIKTMSPTHLSLVATQLYQLFDDPDMIPILQSMKAILLGGSAIPEALIKKSLDLNLPIFKSYGSTEMASQITTTQPSDTIAHFASSGKILAHREIGIAADGEILVRGKTLCHGYIVGDSISPAVDENGWFHTNDLGEIDADGYLTVFGRKDNMFISGGENIHAEEIERVLEQFEGIERAIVVPVPNDTFGQRPVAFLKLKSGFHISEINRDEFRKKLPGYKIPDHFFEWIDDNPDMKPNRQLLQEKAERLLRG